MKATVEGAYNFNYQIMKLRDTKEENGKTHYYWSPLAGFTFKDAAEEYLELLQESNPNSTYRLYDMTKEAQIGQHLS